MYIIHPRSPTKNTVPLVMDRRGREDKERDRQTAGKKEKIQRGFGIWYLARQFKIKEEGKMGGGRI